MKVNQVKFICDECGKITLEDELLINSKNKNVFPYRYGWVYLYLFNFQRSSEEDKVVVIERKSIQDRHFCSIGCFKSYICKLLEKLQNMLFSGMVKMKFCRLNFIIHINLLQRSLKDLIVQF